MDQAKRASLQHRLKRLELWVSLWLVRAAAFLQQLSVEPRRGAWRDWLDARLTALAKCVMHIFLCHASLRVDLKAMPNFAGRFDDPRNPRAGASVRAAIGSALRGAFRAKTFAGRLQKIRRALDNRERLIARLVRRLRRGLTRRAFAHARAIIVWDIGGDGLLFPDAASMRGPNTS